MRTPTSCAECFSALDLKPNASEREVRQAYLDLVKVWHPDRFESDPELRLKAQEKLKVINAAYDKISAFFSSQKASDLDQKPSQQKPQCVLRIGKTRYYTDRYDDLDFTAETTGPCFRAYDGSESMNQAILKLAQMRSLEISAESDLSDEEGQRVRARLHLPSRKGVVNVDAKCWFVGLLFFICLTHIRDFLAEGKERRRIRIIRITESALRELGWDNQAMFRGASYLKAEHDLVNKVAERLVVNVREDPSGLGLASWSKVLKASWFGSGLEDSVRVLANIVRNDAPQREWLH